MGNRGRFKYVCEDCQAENWLTSRERGSRFMPRCSSCGSTWLIPSKRSISSEKMQEWHEAKIDSQQRQDKKMGKI